MNRITVTAAILLLLYLCCGCNLDKLISGDPPEAGDIKTDASGFVVQPLDTARFWIEATDPAGGTLGYKWTVNGGEIIGSSGQSELIWRAPIKGGNYSINVEISNKEDNISRSEVIKVPSLTAPRVNILEPAPDSYVVQYSDLTIKASAIHENNIQVVQLWIDDTYTPSTPAVHNDVYEFVWKIDAAPGNHELKVRAVAQLTGATGQDSLTIHVEGIVAGKK